jgi:hypothetical protein
MSAAAIETIMNKFDFVKVRDAMEAVEWAWVCDDLRFRVPSVDDLRKTARKLLADAVNRRYCGEDDGGDYATATGGLIAISNTKNKALRLEFTIAETMANTETGEQDWD